MKKVVIKFPQIVFETRIVEVSDEKHEELLHYASDSEKVDFIWENMTEQEQMWTEGKHWIESSMDAGYGSVKDVID